MKKKSTFKDKINNCLLWKISPAGGKSSLLKISSLREKVFSMEYIPRPREIFKEKSFSKENPPGRGEIVFIENILIEGKSVL